MFINALLDHTGKGRRSRFHLCGSTECRESNRVAVALVKTPFCRIISEAGGKCSKNPTLTWFFFLLTGGQSITLAAQVRALCEPRQRAPGAATLTPTPSVDSGISSTNSSNNGGGGGSEPAKKTPDRSAETKGKSLAVGILLIYARFVRSNVQKNDLDSAGVKKTSRSEESELALAKI